MKLFSGVHDYYDGVARHGVDTDIEYIRHARNASATMGLAQLDARDRAQLLRLIEGLNPKNQGWPFGEPGARGKARWRNTTRWANEFIAGELLCVGRESRLVWTLWWYGDEVASSHGYEATHERRCESAHAIIEATEALNDRAAKATKQRLKETCGGYAASTGRARAEIIDDHAGQQEFGQLVRQWTQCPVVRITHASFASGDAARETVELRWTENPTIGEAGASRVWGAEQAYQLISNWVSNQARPEAQTATVDDKHLARQKGFNEHSFRNEPGQPKHRTRRDRVAQARHEVKGDGA